MPEILEIVSVQRRLFAPNSIPWHQLALMTWQKELTERYSFNQGGPKLSADGMFVQIVGAGGEFSTDKRTIAVPLLTIEQNVIEFQVAGESSDADIFFSDLEKFIDATLGTSLIEHQYTLTHQTLTVVRLSAEFRALLSRDILRFLEESAKPELQRADARAELVPAQLRWEVRYAGQDTSFVYLPRPFVIEPRAGSRIADRLYFIQSPTDSVAHRRLVERLDSVLSSQDR